MGTAVTTTVLVVIFGVLFYLAPSIVALLKKKRNSVAILALNILLGWTLIGWVVSLVWALTSDSDIKVIIMKDQTNGKKEG